MILILVKTVFIALILEEVKNLIFQVGDKYITAGWHENHKIVSVNKNGASAYGVYNCEIYYFQDMKLQGNNTLILGGGDKVDNAVFALEKVIFD